MKKLSYLFAATALVSLSFNSFAGNEDLPKAGPHEEKVEITTPNDDPNAPPPLLSTTYYLISRKATIPTMTADELAALPAGYYNTSIVYFNAPIPSGGNLLTLSATCRANQLNAAMCSGCRTWGTFFISGLTVTSTNIGFAFVCP